MLSSPLLGIGGKACVSGLRSSRDVTLLYKAPSPGLDISRSPCPRKGNEERSTESSVSSLQNWWSSTAALQVLKKKRYEKPTQLRIYEVGDWGTVLRVLILCFRTDPRIKHALLSQAA